MSKVNLDAIIPREDFEVQDQTPKGIARNISTISITDLKEGSFFFSAMRKPDFQRETNEWDTNKVCELIESFINGELIPAIILWRSAGSYTFIIDGSHRISALAAWINDDYGDGRISRSFYDERIPEEQLKIAEQTRQMVKKRIGAFSEYEFAIKNPNKVDSDIASKAIGLGALALQLQWVEGDSSTAESSFFKINQQAAPLDPTEIRLLKARKKPNGVAARAIIRSGKGHKYWSNYPIESQVRIQELAKEINEILFTPDYDKPIKTLDLPIGGKLYSSQTLQLVLEFVNIVNNIDEKTEETLSDDHDGTETIKFLTNCKDIARRINSNHSSSLGLHPVIYFYSIGGRHKIASFFAIIALIMEMEASNSFKEFTRIREQFEHILYEYDYLVQQIVRKYRSATKSYPYIKDFYLKIIEKLLVGKKDNEVIKEIINLDSFSYLTEPIPKNKTSKKSFSTEVKSAAFIKEAIDNALKCKICNGYIHRNAISIDHILREKDGGVGALENAQLTHPYCNTTFKN